MLSHQRGLQSHQRRLQSCLQRGRSTKQVGESREEFAFPHAWAQARALPRRLPLAAEAEQRGKLCSCLWPWLSSHLWDKAGSLGVLSRRGSFLRLSPSSGSSEAAVGRAHGREHLPLPGSLRPLPPVGDVPSFCTTNLPNELRSQGLSSPPGPARGWWGWQSQRGGHPAWLAS